MTRKQVCRMQPMEVISSTVELLTSMAFLIFASVMLSSFIVSSYKNKTMQIMFSYPVKRQKILISQMLAVWIFNAAALILTKLLIYGCIQAGSAFMTSSFIIDFDITDAGFYIQLIVFGQMGYLWVDKELLPETYVVGAVFTVLAIWRHRANVKRLLTGTENKFSISRSGSLNKSK